MSNRTWKLNLMATDDYPATTLEGVSHEDATKIVRGLMYGPGSTDYAHVRAAVAGLDRREAPLAA